MTNDKLLNSHELAASSVVANCSMNRERRLSGSNSYERDLGISILPWLRDHSSPVSWIDLCCGAGLALIEAAESVAREGSPNCRIEGIDLAGLFARNPHPEVLTLRITSLEDWQPEGQYNLVTCVHGLHYVGDKLAAIAKAARALHPGGLFLANLDLANFRHADGRSASRMVAARLRKNSFKYDPARRLVSCLGSRQADFGLRYLGADDRAGPNYTGQAAVNSFYAVEGKQSQ